MIDLKARRKDRPREMKNEESVCVIASSVLANEFLVKD